MEDRIKMISLETAFEIVDKTLAGVAVDGETVPVRDAVGRTLLTDQVSMLDLPPFNKSAMDGYAVLADDPHDRYRLLETVPAGRMPSATLEPGTTIKVMTGTAVPQGTAKVVMVEHTREEDGFVEILKTSSAANICKEAEDIRAGQTVLTAGTALSALDVANLVSCGLGQVQVARRIRAAILATGDELVDSPDQLAPGKIMNSNGPMLAGLAGEFGLHVTGQRIVRDDQAETAAALREALDRADLVVLSGGVSVGDFDYVAQAISQVGMTLHFTKVGVKPGRPMTFASSGPKAVFGLPGNPVSVYLMFHLFVLRAAALLTGHVPDVATMSLPLAGDFKRRKAERREFVPCRLREDGTVAPVEFHGSAHLSALSGADGWFIVPAGTVRMPAGQKVLFTTLKRSVL